MKYKDQIVCRLLLLVAYYLCDRDDVKKQIEMTWCAVCRGDKEDL